MEQPGGSNQPAAQEQEPTVEEDISRDPTPPPQVEDERPVLQGEEQPIQEEAVVARENDSFDATVAIVPRSQQLARNSIRPTPYDDVAHIVTTPVHKFHDFVYKYINVIGQVVSVFRTTKGSVVIRIWDGTAHKFVHNTHLFFAEDAWIEYYYSQPMKQFQDLPKEYFVDIVVYGEFIYIAENLRSGDMIHLVNVHMYRPKTQRQITPSVHENGQAYHRQIVLLDEEEQIIVDKKSLLVEKLEYVKANSNGGNVSRMAGFFNRPSAQVRPLLQQSPRASTMPGTSASTGRMLSEFHTARHILTEREVSESKDVASVGGQKRSVVDDDVGLIEQPLKKSPKLMPTTQKRPPAPADVAPAVPSTSLSNCLAPPHKDGRAAESSTLVPTVQQHEKIPDPLSQCSKDALESYLEAFFRNKINLRTENVDYMLPSTSGMRAEQSIYNFLNRKPALINCSVQTSPQPSPVKKSNKAVQTNIEPFRPATRDSSAQKTPVKMRNADCVTDPAETRVAQTSPFRAPTTNVVSSPITSPYQSVYRRIKKEATVSPLLKSPPAPRPPSRADSLTRDMVSRRGTKRTAVAQEDSRPPVPPHKKKSKTESPRKSIENKPEVDSIVLKPRCYTKPQQNIFAKPKYPAKRAGEEEKPPIQSSPAQNLRIRPARESSVSSISSRTRSAKMKPSGSEEEPEQKPVRIVVINRSFLETEVQPSWSQQVNVATRRRSTRGESYKTSEVRPIKFER